jgi:hypothetical protein
MHLQDGELRAYLDGGLAGAELDRVKSHLEGCSLCQDQAALLQERSESVRHRLEALAPGPGEAPARVDVARLRLQSYQHTKENETMFNRLFNRRTRPAWAVMAVIALLSIAMTFPSVRAAANSFLGLFRVQKVEVVQVNPGNLPEQLGSSSQLEALFSQNVKIEEGGSAQPAADAAEASAKAGFDVRLPANSKGQPALTVQPGGKVTFNIDLNQVKAVLHEIGRDDISLPKALDGATVNVDIPAGVIAQYGDCEFDPQAMQKYGEDPDNQRAPRLPGCTSLMQMPSPTITAPPGLDVAQVGEAFLQVMGMSQEEAARFAANVDWTTTLVVPIPRYGVTSQDVAVDGVTGSLLLQERTEGPTYYLLLWVKDGILYAITGQGSQQSALDMASSMK